MSRRLLLASILFTVLAGVAISGVNEAEAATTTPIVDRIFYMSGGNLLSSRPPPGNPSPANLTGQAVVFKIPSLLLSDMILSGNLEFSLFANASISGPTQISINGTFREKTVGGTWNNFTVESHQDLFPDIQQYNFTGSFPATTLRFGSEISVAISAKTSPRANVTLLWGSNDYASHVVFPLSGYATLDPDLPVEILDSSRNPKTSFDLNSTDHVVYFRVSLLVAFGLEDIQRTRINVTIIDPSLHSVAGGTNLTMLQFPQGPSASFSFPYITSWVYPSNSPQGTYQVYVDIVDDRNVIIFTFRGPATFVLFRGLYLPPPLNLWPYFTAAGIGLVGGVFYIRRRRRRSYLAPFEHFNSLTGGEIDGGTIVTIEGNTGSGKTMLSQQLMFEDLKKGRPCIFVATGDFPSNVRASMKNLGLDVTGYEQNGLLTFVDGYSSEAGQESREKFSTPSLSDLTTLGVKISSSLPSESFKGGSLYFDSLTPLASKAKPESIVSFVQSVGARVKGMSGKAFFTVGPSVDGSVQRQLEDLSDCLVQMEAFEESGVRKSRLRVAKYRARKVPQGWVIYTIEDGKGIIFYSKKAKK